MIAISVFIFCTIDLLSCSKDLSSNSLPESDLFKDESQKYDHPTVQPPPLTESKEQDKSDESDEVSTTSNTVW